MNEYEKSLLAGIKVGLREDIPRHTRAIESENILKAMELDNELQLGIFTDIERYTIIMAEKNKYLNSNSDIKQMIKKVSK